MRTSQNVEELALYSSACCKEEAVFDRDDFFPRCPACERLCFWVFVERVVHWTELEEQTQAA